MKKHNKVFDKRILWQYFCVFGEPVGNVTDFGIKHLIMLIEVFSQ